MNRFFRAISGFFLSERGQLAFAMLLLVLVPATLVLNSLIAIQSAQRNMTLELQRKSRLAERILQVTVKDFVGDAKKLQQVVVNVKNSDSEIWGVDVLTPTDATANTFTVVASTETKNVGQSVDANTAQKPVLDYNLKISWLQDQMIASTTFSSDASTVNQKFLPGDKNQRFWVVVSPLQNSSGVKTALVSLKLSSQIIDDNTQAAVTRAIGVLVASILIIVLLLAANTRLFQYTVLFRKLKEVDQMKDDFISVASHELRTPITGIRGYVSMVADGSLGPISPETKKALDVVAQSAERLNGLVEDLLNVSRIEQGRLDLELTQVDPLLVINEVITELMPMANDKHLEVAYKGPATLPTLSLNHDRFKQVMVNLVGNGIKYTPKGSVHIEVDQQPKNIRLKVSDTGLGMSPADMQRLFTKFYRIRNDGTKDIAGTGLGLWITKEIIERMKGTIEVESIEGTGSQFIVTFPLSKKA